MFKSSYLYQADIFKENIFRISLKIPNIKHEEIINFVINRVKEHELTPMTYTKSFSHQELTKFQNNINNFFGDKVFSETLDILSFIDLSPSEQCSCSFSEILNQQMHLKKVIPNALYLPDEYHTLSHVYIGHEMIHLLKDCQIAEYLDYIIYGEVLPILYEFIQMENKNKDEQKKIIYGRLNRLLDTYYKLYSDKTKETFKDYPDKYIYHLYQGNVYFLSFYYALLLYDIYKSDPKKVLRIIQKVLLHKSTTKKLLKYFGISDNLNSQRFDKQLQLLLKNEKN